PRLETSTSLPRGPPSISISDRERAAASVLRGVSCEPTRPASGARGAQSCGSPASPGQAEALEVAYSYCEYTMSMQEAVIVDCLRTVVGKAPRGALRNSRPDDL